MQIFQLVLVHFDNLENSVAAAYQEKLIVTFVDDDKTPAHKKCGDYIKKLPATTFYLGHDCKVYPQLIVRTFYAQ